MMKGAIAIILFVLLSGFPTQTDATFVKCAPPRSVKAEYDDATRVFLGKVIAEEERKLPNPIGPFKYDVAQVYRFQVTQWWKGGTTEKIDIHVVKIRLPNGKHVFGPEQIIFQKDESYLVYGFADNGLNLAYGCTRTRLLKFAQEDLQILGNGQLPKTSS